MDFFDLEQIHGVYRGSAHCSVVPSGVEVITAPVGVTAQFKEPMSLPARVTIKFWESTKNRGHLSFLMQDRGDHRSHLMGQISRLT